MMPVVQQDNQQQEQQVLTQVTFHSPTNKDQMLKYTTKKDKILVVNNLQIHHYVQLPLVNHIKILTFLEQKQEVKPFKNQLQLLRIQSRDKLTHLQEVM